MTPKASLSLVPEVGVSTVIAVTDTVADDEAIEVFLGHVVAEVSNANDDTVMFSIGTPLDAMSHISDEPVENCSQDSHGHDNQVRASDTSLQKEFLGIPMFPVHFTQVDALLSELCPLETPRKADPQCQHCEVVVQKKMVSDCIGLVVRKLPNHCLFVGEVREDDGTLPIRGVQQRDIITAVNDMQYHECDLLQRLKESTDIRMKISRHRYPLCATTTRCHYFLRGWVRGNACRFKHIDDDEPDYLREEELRSASTLGLCKAYDVEVARNAGGHNNIKHSRTCRDSTFPRRDLLSFACSSIVHARFMKLVRTCTPISNTLHSFIQSSCSIWLLT